VLRYHAPQKSAFFVALDNSTLFLGWLITQPSWTLTRPFLMQQEHKKRPGSPSRQERPLARDRPAMQTDQAVSPPGRVRYGEVAQEQGKNHTHISGLKSRAPGPLICFQTAFFLFRSSPPYKKGTLVCAPQGYNLFSKKACRAVGERYTLLPPPVIPLWGRQAGAGTLPRAYRRTRPYAHPRAPHSVRESLPSLKP
jgi:hypothetical protein